MMIKLKNICIVRRYLSIKHIKTIVKVLFFVDGWFLWIRKKCKISTEILDFYKKGVTFIPTKA